MIAFLRFNTNSKPDRDQARSPVGTPSSVFFPYLGRCRFAWVNPSFLPGNTSFPPPSQVLSVEDPSLCALSVTSARQSLCEIRDQVLLFIVRCAAYAVPRRCFVLISFSSRPGYPSWLHVISGDVEVIRSSTSRYISFSHPGLVSYGRRLPYTRSPSFYA